MFQLTYINRKAAIKPELCPRFMQKQTGTNFDKIGSL